MAKLSIRNLSCEQQAVLMRVDFNVPLDSQGAITDDTRIRAALPSIKMLLEKGAKLTLCSHLGRPKGAPDAQFSLKAAAERLAQLLDREVAFACDCIGEKAQSLRDNLGAGEVLLLENTRFYNEEKSNDAHFAKQLAYNADFFVNDAFGSAHRAHASTEGVTHFVKQSAMGLLIERELEFLCEKLDSPESPFLVIMGGAKVSDKIEVITSLLKKADTFIIGGAMAYTFWKAQGFSVGSSLVEEDKLQLALDILELAKQSNTRFLLPIDNCIAQEFKDGVETRFASAQGEGIPEGWMGLDVGPKSIEIFSEEIAKAKTIVWNGPMGVFEMTSFAAGTRGVAEAVAKSDALSIVGGGDSVTAIKKFGLEEQVSFISTGGGASLELLEGKELPGVIALSQA